MVMNILNAHDILKHYAEQKRNFQNLNLSQISLQGADLKEIDLSHANLNRADLSSTNLSCATETLNSTIEFIKSRYKNPIDG
jgi:uncharacterized protein YjbI with pentapeptide repeats